MGSTWFLGGLIGVLTWHGAPIVTSPAYDPSWYTAINWATALGLHYGTEFVYTYGPLGFGERALATFGAPMATYSALYLLATNLGLGISLLWAARRGLPLAVAFAAALAVALLVTEITPAIAFVLAAVALTDRSPTARLALEISGPLLAAIGLLAKLNDGIAIALMIAIALVVVDRTRPRRLAACVGAFALLFLAGWFATGQGIANLDDYVVGSIEIVSGYPVGLVAEGPLVGWDRAAAALMIVAVVAAAALTTRSLDAPRRIGTLAVVLILCYVSAKQGFVRHDAVHVSRFIPAMLLPWLVLPFGDGSRRAIPVGAIAAIGLVSIPMVGGSITRARWDLPHRLSNVDQLATLLLPGKRSETETNARRSLRDFYALPAYQEAELRGGGVHVEPAEVSLLWGYDFSWKPLPVFRSTAAYTPPLDRRNAEALAGDDAPELILRHHPLTDTGKPLATTFALDHNYWPWVSPAATLETFCRYQPLSTNDRYQVLIRVPYRCGDPRTLGTVTTTYGETVPVPRPRPGEDGVVLAKITGLGPAPLEALKKLVYRADGRTITFGDGTSYAIRADNAGSGLIMWIPKASDYPPPFRLAPNPKTIRIGESSSLNGGDGEIEIEFVFVPLQATPP